MPEKIALVTNDPETRQSLSTHLSSWGNFQLAFVFDSLEQFVKTSQFKTIVLDCIICDVLLSEVNCIELIEYARESYPGTPVMVLSTIENKDFVFKALYNGAMGFVLKTEKLEQVAEDILEVIKGGAVISPPFAMQLAKYFNVNHQTLSNIGWKSEEDKFTRKEKEVLSLIYKGLPNKEIAQALHVSIDTVKFHIKNILFKMQVSSRKELFIKNRGKFDK